MARIDFKSRLREVEGSGMDWERRPRREFRGRALLDSAEADVLDLEELLDAVPGSLASEAGLLHAAERRHLVRDDADVHAHDAGLERLGSAEDAAHVAGVEVRAQAELGVVREPDHLRVVLEAEERRDRAEGLLARDLHAGLHPGEERGLEEAPAQRVAMPAEHDLRALRHGIGD